MHPISFVKAHPVATVVLMGAGAVFGPWLLRSVNGLTGVNVSLPSYGGGGGG